MNEKSGILQILALIVACMAPAITAVCQIPSPFAEDEKRQMEEMQKSSVLTQDSIVIVDTTIVFNPDTYEETWQIVRTKTSLWDYCVYTLGINNPDRLLDGETMTITDPATYEQMKIRWNHATNKIDTIQ